jgi:hypothetical protein
MEWYEMGDAGEHLRDVIDAFIDGFTNEREFSAELDAMGLTYEEQNEIIRSEIRVLETQIAESAQGTIH